MGSSSSMLRLQELTEFRKLNTSIENVEIPARGENRTVTDRKGFIMFGMGILLLVPFLAYTLTKSDVRYITSGSDACGNFCGYQNYKVEGIDCSGMDYTTKPFEFVGECVSTCPSGQSVAGRCLNSASRIDFDEPAFNSQQASGSVWWKYLPSVFVAIALSVLTLLGMRFLPGIVVTAIIYLSMALLVVATGLIWYLYIRTSNWTILVVATVWTILAAILLLIFIVLFKKIELVVQLYKEAAKTLGDMPLLVLLPIPMLFVQIVVWIVFTILTILILCARQFYQESGTYARSTTMTFTLLLTLFFAVWTVKFLSGIYYMTVSGSVGAWFFSRNKDCLGSPICTGFINTVKYHLGTVSFGSFFLALFAAVKAVLQPLLRNKYSTCFSCCSCMEVLFNLLSENAYTETALHGQSYIRSAKRATKLLVQNAKSLIAVTCIGDFVLIVIIFIVGLIASGISYALFSDEGVWPLYICLILNFLVVFMAFSTFQIILQTLFLCFCEDSVLNDGVSKPYYMSRGLMEFVERSKREGKRFN